jgi:hypothetical protein
LQRSNTWSGLILYLVLLRRELTRASGAIAPMRAKRDAVRHALEAQTTNELARKKRMNPRVSK